jgi:hypothetical protein
MALAPREKAEPGTLAPKDRHREVTRERRPVRAWKNGAGIIGEALLAKGRPENLAASLLGFRQALRRPEHVQNVSDQGSFCQGENEHVQKMTYVLLTAIVSYL